MTINPKFLFFLKLCATSLATSQWANSFTSTSYPNFLLRISSGLSSPRPSVPLPGLFRKPPAPALTAPSASIPVTIHHDSDSVLLSSGPKRPSPIHSESLNSRLKWRHPLISLSQWSPTSSWWHLSWTSVSQDWILTCLHLLWIPYTNPLSSTRPECFCVLEVCLHHPALTPSECSSPHTADCLNHPSIPWSTNSGSQFSAFLPCSRSTITGCTVIHARRFVPPNSQLLGRVQSHPHDDTPGLPRYPVFSSRPCSLALLGILIFEHFFFSSSRQGLAM